MEKSIKILWNDPVQRGSVQLRNSGTLDCDRFSVDNGILTVTVRDAKLSPGSYGTIVTVRAENDFSFFLRDVRADYPIYIPEYRVAVTEASDTRNYQELISAVCDGRKSKIAQMEAAPEETFYAAASRNRDMAAPIWLGLSRDVRMFEGRIHTLSDLGDPWDTIQPMYHHSPIRLPELGEEPVRYNYFAGRGVGCRREISRRLEDGILPILNVESIDGEITYRQKIFVTLETSPLTRENVHGTHYLVADLYAKTPTERIPAQQAETDRLHHSEIHQPEETVLFLRITAENTSSAPKYAYLRIPQPNVPLIAELAPYVPQLAEGLAFYDRDRVFMTATLNGQPVQDVEYAVLLAPGETAVFEFKLPHSPVSSERARKLMAVDFDAALASCQTYWQEKLDRLAKMRRRLLQD